MKNLKIPKIPFVLCSWLVSWDVWIHWGWLPGLKKWSGSDPGVVLGGCLVYIHQKWVITLILCTFSKKPSFPPENVSYELCSDIIFLWYPIENDVFLPPLFDFFIRIIKIFIEYMFLPKIPTGIPGNIFDDFFFMSCPKCHNKRFSKGDFRFLEFSDFRDFWTFGFCWF